MAFYGRRSQFEQWREVSGYYWLAGSPAGIGQWSKINGLYALRQTGRNGKEQAARLARRWNAVSETQFLIPWGRVRLGAQLIGSGKIDTLIDY